MTADNTKFQEAIEILDAMPVDKRTKVIELVFQMVLDDVKSGVKGERAGIFFEQIALVYEDAHFPCYFSGQIDGNEIPFGEGTAYLCESCRVKLDNILTFLSDLARASQTQSSAT